MDEITEFMKRGIAMEKVKNEAKALMREYTDRIETHKPEITSNIVEMAHEEAGIRVTNVVIWDQGSVDIDFGEML
jgi:hypothetical protein